MRGHLDLVTLDRVEGWAFDDSFPDRPVVLRLLDNGDPIAEIVADQARSGLKEAGIGNGRNGFAFTVPNGWDRRKEHRIQLVQASDGRELENSPWILAAEPAFAPAPIAAMLQSDSLQGWLDRATRQRIEGWALDTDFASAPVALQILDNGALIARVIANRYRKDLAVAIGTGTGHNAFGYDIPVALDPLVRHVIQVRRERDGAELPGSPCVIAASGDFGADLEQAVAGAVEALDRADACDRALGFLVAQADRLLQKMADIDSQRAERLSYRQFLRRWGAQPEAAPYAVADPGKRALVIDDQLPDLGRDAGSQAVTSHMLALRHLGYAVSFVAAEEMTKSGPAADPLTEFGITLCGMQHYASVEEILRRQALGFDVIYLHRASNASRYLALARRYCPKARILYSVADLHHVRLQRQAAIEERPELLGQSRQMKFTEYSAAWSADAVLTHSQQEAGLLRTAIPEARVYVVPWAIPIEPLLKPIGARHGLAFIGGYGHRPNVDAAHFLVKEIMPLVWRENPDIECLLVGSAMPDEIAALAQPGIEIVGAAPNLSEIFQRVRLTVAPLRFGAGIKGKVLSSFAAGVPCVMSAVAAEGLALPPTLASLVANDAAGHAERIVRLHMDEMAVSAASDAARAFVAESYTQDNVVEILRAAIAGRASAGRDMAAPVA